ncbi:MAG: DUF3794 domain-containing protein [Hyphomonadaceae bacterium]|nr:DUF3794 domain-containing protein [Clostridia bacterium]
MAIALSKENMLVKATVAEATFQTLVEGDIIVPDVKPDIGEVLQVDGVILIHKQEPLHDRVSIGGSVQFTILYVPENQAGVVKSIRTSFNFNHIADVQGVRPTMHMKLLSDVEHVDFSLIHSRKLNVKAVVSLKTNISEQKNLEFITDIDEPNIESFKQTIKVFRVLGDASEQISLKEDLEVPSGKPSINEILKSNAEISGKDAKVMQNKVFIKGDLYINTLYTGELNEDGLQVMEHIMPFTEVFAIEGVQEGANVQVDCQVQDIFFEPKEDADGDVRVMTMSAIIQASVSVGVEVTCKTIADCYHTVDELSVKHEQIALEQIIEDVKAQIQSKEVIALEDGQPNMIQGCNLTAKPYIADISIANGKLTADGILEVSFLYLTDSAQQPIYNIKQEIPFQYVLDLQSKEGDLSGDIKAEVSHVSFAINNQREVEVRAIIALDSKVIKPSTTEVISDIDVLSGVKCILPSPSIIIYYVQKGDNLWKIARKYKTTEQDILTINDTVNFDKLTVGLQLFIPRRSRKCG